jgi:hypothetical protein
MTKEKKNSKMADRFLVMDLIQEMTITDSDGNTKKVSMVDENLIGVLPLFATKKGAEEYDIKIGGGRLVVTIKMEIK